MALLSNKDLLRRIPIFSSLTEDQLGILATSFVKRKFERNAFVFCQGEQSEAFFVILAGQAHVVTQDKKGREVIFSRLKQGDYFGEMSLIDGKGHSTSVRTVAVCELLMIKREVFQSFLPVHDSPQHCIMLSLVSRLRDADRKIESFALLKGQERIFQFFKQFAVPDKDGNLVFSEKISLSDIGKNIGSSRELVFRMIAKFKADGSLVKQSDGSYRVTDH